MNIEHGPEWLPQLISGATAIAASLVGRLMFHAGQVQAGRRRFWSSKALACETITAVGMGLVLDAIAGRIGLDGQVRVGFVTGGSYIGPRLIEALWSVVQRRLAKA